MPDIQQLLRHEEQRTRTGRQFADGETIVRSHSRGEVYGGSQTGESNDGR